MSLRDSLKAAKQKFFPDKRFRQARVWSNKVLRSTVSVFGGDIIDVSGWKDEDKEGGHYQDYFPQARSYTVSNFYGEYGTADGVPGEIFIDLEQPLPQELCQKFDVVFNHTTLEHIFEVETAFANLAALTKDVLIVVVPFLQQLHIVEGSFEDYWRLTPFALKKLCEKHGLTPIYCAGNNVPRQSVYVIMIASKHPEIWAGKLPETSPEVYTHLGNRIFG